MIQEQILHLEVLAIAEAGQNLACKKVMGRSWGTLISIMVNMTR